MGVLTGEGVRDHIGCAGVAAESESQVCTGRLPTPARLGGWKYPVQACDSLLDMEAVDVEGVV